jgi:hypothetical protein
LWWYKKCDGFSVNWKMFIKDLLKRFHEEEEDDSYTKLTRLHQTGTVSEYTHEWEIIATRNPKLTETQLLKKYIARLKYSFCNELNLWKPQNVDEAKSIAMLIERKILAQQRVGI